MAMAADISSNHRSPNGTAFSGDGLNSPEFRRRNLRSPWAQVVRGEPESISTVDQSPVSSSSSLSSMAASLTQTPASDCAVTKAAPAPSPPDSLAPSGSSDANDGNATAPPRKPAWNKPSNGVVEAGPVMGAVSWPALSESARASPKPAVDSSLKPAFEGSVPVSQEHVNAPPQRQATNNAKSNSSPRHPMPSRQRSSRRGGGGSSVGGPARGGFVRTPPPPPPPPCPLYQIPQSSYCNLMPTIPDPSAGEPLFRSNNWDPRPVAGFVPQTNAAPDHRSFFPRGNFGFHPRGDGHYHNNRGGRRDQDRGLYPNARDVHLQQHRPPTRGFMRPSPSYTAQFPQPVRPHGNHLAHPVVYIPTLPLEPFRSMPFMPPPAMYLPAADPTVSELLVRQIDYYFSDANLVNDPFLKSNMDDQGWVPVSVIAEFPRVKNLTNNNQFILESLRNSDVVEVQDDKMRRRNEWMKWIPNANRVGTGTGLASSSHSDSGDDKLVSSFERMRVDEEEEDESQSVTISDSNPHTEMPALEAADHSKLTNGELNKEDVVQSDI